MFEDVMDAMLMSHPAQHFLDSYSIRNLVLSSPASIEVRLTR